METIQFFREGIPPVIKFSKKITRQIGREITGTCKRKVSGINIIFCDDAHLLEINQKYLRHDYYTDIITFDYEADTIQSDLYISTERVNENAARLSIDASLELYRVMFHGFLHLSGYGDKTQQEKDVMRSQENYYLAKIKSV